MLVCRLVFNMWKNISTLASSVQRTLLPKSCVCSDGAGLACSVKVSRSSANFSKQAVLGQSVSNFTVMKFNMLHAEADVESEIARSEFTEMSTA